MSHVLIKLGNEFSDFPELVSSLWWIPCCQLKKARCSIKTALCHVSAGSAGRSVMGVWLGCRPAACSLSTKQGGRHQEPETNPAFKSSKGELCASSVKKRVTGLQSCFKKAWSGEEEEESVSKQVPVVMLFLRTTWFPLAVSCHFLLAQSILVLSDVCWCV